MNTAAVSHCLLGPLVQLIALLTLACAMLEYLEILASNCGQVHRSFPK